MCKSCSQQKVILHSLGYYDYQHICTNCSRDLRSDRVSILHSLLEKHRFLSKSLMRKSGNDVFDGEELNNEAPKQPTVSIFASNSFIT